MAPETPTSLTDRIDVTLPLRSEFVSTLRTLTASVGADAGFSVDELDDIRLALSEVFSVLVANALDGTRARTSLAVNDGVLVVSMGTEQADLVVELDELAANILGAVTDSYEVGLDSVTFTKRSHELVVDPTGS